jgi:RND superfamily putative drug exporter
VVAVWIATVAVLGLLGLGLESKLTSHAIVIDGSESKREKDLVGREFGTQEAIFVLLEGPPAEIERQGRRLERDLDDLPRTVVVSPWSDGGSIDGLRPAADKVALLVNSGLRPGEDAPDLLPPIRAAIDEDVGASVQVSLAGAPVLVEAFRSGTADAVSAAEKIALPTLLIILLLVFRSVLAAAIPVLVGGAVVASARGVLYLLAGTVEIEAFALGAAGMMGLALGVDYALLIISRFREELAQHDDPAVAAHVTLTATARSVVPAGCGLLLAMLVASYTVPSALVQSVAVTISVASALSVISAIVVVPAILTLLGARIDRWTLPRRAKRAGAVARWGQRISAKPGVVVAIVLFLVVSTCLAFTLKTEIGSVAQLSPDNEARQDQERVQDALGPGWVAPVEIAMVGNDGPVTTPARLRALAAFQRKVERDPDVDSMAGLAAIERKTRPLGGFEDKLAAQQRGLDRLGNGIGKARDGAAANTSGLNGAASGAQQLDAAVGESHAGAALIAEGARNASTGSARLTDGLDHASDGSGDLAEGTAESSAGAGKLSKALARAADNAGSSDNASVLRNAMRSGNESLEAVHDPLKASEDQLAAARQALEEMSAGRADPQYAPALAAVNSAIRELTGAEPGSEEPLDPDYEGVATEVEDAEAQFGLGNYLSSKIRKSGIKASDGLEKLARSSARLDRGLGRLAGASDQVSEAIVDLSEGGEELSPALVRLSRGAEHLAGGLGEVQNGAAGLASGLGSGAQRSQQLSGALGRIEDKVEGQADGTDSLGASPGLFRSGYFYLAGLDGAKPSQRAHSAFLVNLEGGGGAARMLVIPASDPSTAAARELNRRIRDDAAQLAGETGTEVAVGGPLLAAEDIDATLRDSAPLTRLVLCLVTLLVLIPVVRSLTLPLIAALLNLLTVSATFGLLALLFNGSLLGGPGYVDSSVVTATIMVIFGLAIDYEVFLFARMREEYVRTGSSSAAISNGLFSTAPVITGAALIMIAVFVVFSFSTVPSLRNFGVAQAIAVFIDAFIVRLVLLPGLMRMLGDRAWWCPAWLDRVLPGAKRSRPSREEAPA